MRKSQSPKKQHVFTFILGVLTLVLMSPAIVNLKNGGDKERLLTDIAVLKIPSSADSTDTMVIDAHERIRKFRETASSLRPVTDKVFEHNYHNMYGQFLIPYIDAKPGAKVFEIGLGCAMKYGAGASVGLWKKIFPKIELWEADINRNCVDKWKETESMKGVKVLSGDQGNLKTLDDWIRQSGGNFDVIIDDGGHHNCLINTSFEKLWPQLNPGGLYFVEDLHVGRIWGRKKLNEHCDNTPVSTIVKDWIDQLIYNRDSIKGYTYPLPEGMISVHCQNEACVFQKRKDYINDNVPFQEDFNRHQ